MATSVSRWQLLKALTVSSWRSRYRNSVLGLAWGVLEPLSLAIAFVLVFSLLIGGIYDGSAPYPAFVLLGTVLWSLFAQGTTQGGNGVLLRSALARKIYFPREYLSYSYILTILFTGIVNLTVLAGLLAFYRISPGWSVIFFPAILGILLLLVVGISLLLASAFVRLEDLRYVWNLVMTLGLFASPVIYESTRVPPQYAFWYHANPMVPILDTSREVLLYGVWPSAGALVYPALLGLVLFAIGWHIFKRSEHLFAERL